MLAPIFEELSCRWFILSWMRQWLQMILIHLHHDNRRTQRILTGILWAISILAFASLHHPTTLATFLPYCWMGICLGYIYLKCHSIYASMGLHFLINALAITEMFLI